MLRFNFQESNGQMWDERGDIDSLQLIHIAGDFNN